jgi:hypothetical protein
MREVCQIKVIACQTRARSHFGPQRFSDVVSNQPAAAGPLTSCGVETANAAGSSEWFPRVRRNKSTSYD